MPFMLASCTNDQASARCIAGREKTSSRSGELVLKCIRYNGAPSPGVYHSGRAIFHLCVFTSRLENVYSFVVTVDNKIHQPIHIT